MLELPKSISPVFVLIFADVVVILPSVLPLIPVPAITVMVGVVIVAFKSIVCVALTIVEVVDSTFPLKEISSSEVIVNSFVFITAESAKTVSSPVTNEIEVPAVKIDDDSKSAPFAFVPIIFIAPLELTSIVSCAVTSAPIDVFCKEFILIALAFNITVAYSLEVFSS